MNKESMALRIPAICDNCRFVFPSIFAVKEGGSVKIFGMKTGPCPVCGSNGSILNGEYSGVTQMVVAKLYSIRDVHNLLRLQKTIKNVIDKNKKPLKALKDKDPDWKEIWNLLPENKEHAYVFLGLILSFIAIAISFYSVNTPPPEQNIFIEQSFNHFYNSVTPKENHNENKKFQTKPLVKAIRSIRI